MNSNDLDLDWLLRNAVAVGNLEEVKVALGKGANVNARNSVGDTSLMYAAMFGKTDIVEFLISAGADVNAGDDEGRTALVYAFENGHEKTVKLLAESGGLEELRRQMQDEIKQEKDPAKKLELRIRYTKDYKKILSMISKENKLDIKTIKLPSKDRGKFRTIKRARC